MSGDEGHVTSYLLDGPDTLGLVQRLVEAAEYLPGRHAAHETTLDHAGLNIGVGIVSILG